MAPKKYTCDFVEGNCYHVYNRANGNEKLFYNAGNYEYFLRKYLGYLSEYVDTLCYCLLPNHFHFLLRVRDAITSSGGIPEIVEHSISRKVSEQFRRLFITYTQAVNVQQNRSGSLFQKPFKRLALKDEGHFSNLVAYIHTNPCKHGIWRDYQKYPYSSYQPILLKKLFISSEEVLNWFGGEHEYSNFHKEFIERKETEDYIIE